MKRKLTISGGFKHPMYMPDGTAVPYSNMESHATLEIELEEGVKVDWETEFKSLLARTAVCVEDSRAIIKKKRDERKQGQA